MEQIVRTNCFHHFTTSRKPLLTNMHPCMKKISKRKAKQLSKPWITNESKRQLRLKIIILVPRGRAPFGQHQESRPLAVSNTPSLCGCSESSLTNLIDSGLNPLCFQIHSKPECLWTWPEVAILGADQKERSLWGREWWQA